MRVAILDQERCKPNSNAFKYLQKYAGLCGSECIQATEEECKILESACPPCLIRAKLCPDDAVKIINLPEELDTDMIHRFSLNGFRLFRLPAPRKRQVVGILGPNGIGKSTAIKLLSGSLRPNLGDWESTPPDWEEIITMFPRGELRDYLGLVSEGQVTISTKPQHIDNSTTKTPVDTFGKIRSNRSCRFWNFWLYKNISTLIWDM